MASSTEHPYQRGIFYDTMPIPPVPEHCVAVAAGPVTFVVESRLLTNEILMTQLPAGSVDLGDAHYDDFGATVHVTDTAGVEHLRFDCFDREPHYHYLMHGAGGNLICRIDEVAEGDPVEWTVGRLRHRLAPMLSLAGAGALAEAVSDAGGADTAAVDQVAALLRRAQADATHRRGQLEGGVPDPDPHPHPHP